MKTKKRINLYMIKDDLVGNAIIAFGNALKYIFETGNRKKEGISNNTMYYQIYMGHLAKLKGIDLSEERSWIADEFFNALTTTGFIDENELISEFLGAVQVHLSRKENIEYEVWTLPFLFEDSFEEYNRKNGPECEYAEYIKNHIMTKLGFKKQELYNMIITG